MVKIESRYARHDLDVFSGKQFSLIQKVIEFNKKHSNQKFNFRLSILSWIYQHMSKLFFRKIVVFWILVLLLLPLLKMVFSLPYDHYIVIKVDVYRARVLLFAAIYFLIIAGLQYAICHVAGEDFLDNYETETCPLCENKYSDSFRKSRLAEKNCETCFGIGIVVKTKK